MILDNENSFVLMVDIQEKLINAIFNKDLVSKKSSIISKTATILDLPVLVSEQYPKGLGTTISNVKTNLTPTTKYFEKTFFDALKEDTILKTIESLNKKNAIVLGIETHICVYQTVVGLLNRGFNVTIVKDACGSRNEEEYLSALECMRELGAEIKTTEMILFELLKGAKHPNFKEIQEFIK